MPLQTKRSKWISLQYVSISNKYKWGTKRTLFIGVYTLGFRNKMHLKWGNQDGSITIWRKTWGTSRTEEGKLGGPVTRFVFSGCYFRKIFTKCALNIFLISVKLDNLHILHVVDVNTKINPSFQGIDILSITPQQHFFSSLRY